MAETGNPNVYTIYQGIFQCTNISSNLVFNGKVALTNQNDVVFLDNFETSSPVAVDTVLFILPEKCRPAKRCRIPLGAYVKTTPNSNVTTFLDIFPNGEVKNRTPWTNSNLVDILAFGLSFNISGNFY